MYKIITSDGLEHYVPEGKSGPDFMAYSPNSVATRNALIQAYQGNSYVMEEPPTITPITAPQWTAFNSLMLADTRLNAVLLVAMDNAPAATVSLPAALSEVESKGMASFAIVFEAICTAGGATTADREAWAVLAEEANLPTDFIDLVRG